MLYTLYINYTMNQFIGEKINEKTDFSRVPSLTLTMQELEAIPEPPRFEDLKVNSNNDAEENIKDYKISNNNTGSGNMHSRDISRGKMSKTIRFQKRLSSITSVKEQAESLNPNRIRTFTPTMSKLVYKPVPEETQPKNIDIYHVAIPHQSMPASQEDLLYGDNLYEENEIIRQMTKCKTTETLRSANERLVDEIVDSYGSDYIKTVENLYTDEKKLTITFPPEKILLETTQGLLLTPPSNHYHHHTNSIATASDLSTLPEKLFSSPELDNRSCASSVYSEISVVDEDSEVVKKYHSLLMHNIPELSVVATSEDDYVMRSPDEDEWKSHKISTIRLMKPAIFSWDSDFDSSDQEEEEDILDVKSISFASHAADHPKTSYLQHLEYASSASSIFSSSSSNESSAYEEARDYINSPTIVSLKAAVKKTI